jgi:hypothetical protein
MGNIMLNLTLGEPLSLLKKFPCFDKLIELDVLLEGVIHIGVHDTINCLLFNEFMIYFYRVQVFGHIQSVKERWKI